MDLDIFISERRQQKLIHTREHIVCTVFYVNVACTNSSFCCLFCAYRREKGTEYVKKYRYTSNMVMGVMKFTPDVGNNPSYPQMFTVTLD